ncbi:unnamed protein product [Merluccius merluccius]
METRISSCEEEEEEEGERSAREEEEEEDLPDEDLQSSSGLQASLHSRKEQKRRLHIRTSCQKLCELLPLVGEPLDTATTLELTARYISYLNTTLPPDLLNTVNKTVQQNVKVSWKKTKKPPKKRRTIRLKRNTTQRSQPSAQKTPDNAALWRNVPPPPSVSADRRPATLLIAEQPSPPPPPPDPVAMPILLDKSSVPRGQMLRQEQPSSFSTSSFSSSTSSFQSVENNWITPPPHAFCSSAFPSPTFSSTSSPPFNAMTASANVLQTTVPPQATDGAVAGDESVANHVVTLQILDPPAAPVVSHSSTEELATPTAAVNLDAVWNQQDQTIVLSFSLPPAVHDVTIKQVQHLQPLPLEPSVELERENAATTAAAAIGAAPAVRWKPPFDAPPIQPSGVGGSPITTSVQDTVSPYWLDLLLDNCDSLSIPEAIFLNNPMAENHANSHTHSTL